MYLVVQHVKSEVCELQLRDLRDNIRASHSAESSKAWAQQVRLMQSKRQQICACASVVMHEQGMGAQSFTAVHVGQPSAPKHKVAWRIQYLNDSSMPVAISNTCGFSQTFAREPVALPPSAASRTPDAAPCKWCTAGPRTRTIP